MYLLQDNIVDREM